MYALPGHTQCAGYLRKAYLFFDENSSYFVWRHIVFRHIALFYVCFWMHWTFSGCVFVLFHVFYSAQVTFLSIPCQEKSTWWEGVMENFSDRLKIVMLEQKSARDFALLCGISYGVMRAYLAGDSLPGLENIIKISNGGNVEINWLVSGNGPMRHDKSHTPPIYNGADRLPGPEDHVCVPLAESRLAAGNGLPVLMYDEPCDIMAFRRSWVNRMTTGPKNLVAFFVEGDSMAPTLNNGDLILIDQGRVQPRTGAIFAVCVGGDLLQIKRLDVIGGNVRVIADNGRYPATDLPPEQVHVLGQVVWFCRELVRRK